DRPVLLRDGRRHPGPGPLRRLAVHNRRRRARHLVPDGSAPPGRGQAHAPLPPQHRVSHAAVRGGGRRRSASSRPLVTPKPPAPPVKHESITRMRASDSTMQQERPPGGLLPRGPKRAWLIGGVAVLAACLVVIVLVVANSGSSNSPALQSAASGEGAPSAPAGFTQVFLDNFAGPKGAPPSAQNWLYDIGTDWGNHQVEQDTNATSNIYLDGQGNLVIQANKANGKWTSGRI